MRESLKKEFNEIFFASVEHYGVESSSLLAPIFLLTGQGSHRENIDFCQGENDTFYIYAIREGEWIVKKRTYFHIYQEEF